MSRPEVIFFGNGPLADATLSVLAPAVDIIFHARSKEDLETVKSLKREHPAALGVLASFGVMIKPDVLDLFEPEGILNLHPSLLPLYRGASPIESAILAGDSSFSVSIMKLVRAMDAGPIYHQETLESLPLDKPAIYSALASTGAAWLVAHLKDFESLHNSSASPEQLFSGYHLQDDSKATFTQKLDKSLSLLTPEADSADATLRKIVAYQSFPKPKYNFFNQTVIILSAHISKTCSPRELGLKCADGAYVIVDRLQPLSRKPMDARSFLNGLHNSDEEILQKN